MATKPQKQKEESMSYKQLLKKSLKELKEIVLSDTHSKKTKEMAWRVAEVKIKRRWE